MCLGRIDLVGLLCVALLVLLQADLKDACLLVNDMSAGVM